MTFELKQVSRRSAVKATDHSSEVVAVCTGTTIAGHAPGAAEAKKIRLEIGPPVSAFCPETAMTDVLFIQGASEGAHNADVKLAASLAGHLGREYDVRFPQMPAEEEPQYAAWAATLSDQLALTKSTFVLVGHSLGASFVLRYLALNRLEPEPVGVFLASAPFIGTQGWSDADFELPAQASAKLQTMKMFFYQGDADETVPVAHVRLYERAFRHATVRLLPAKNHQLDDDLSAIAADIQRLHRSGEKTLDCGSGVRSTVRFEE